MPASFIAVTGVGGGGGAWSKHDQASDSKELILMEIATNLLPNKLP